MEGWFTPSPGHDISLTWQCTTPEADVEYPETPVSGTGSKSVSLDQGKGDMA